MSIYTVSKSPIARITILTLLCLLWALTWGLTSTVHAATCPPYPSPHLRFGVNVDGSGGKTIDNYTVDDLNLGWYLNYGPTSPSPHAARVDFAHMIRLGIYRSGTYTTTVAPLIAANPGALWILGNEPDRDLQDGATPEEYATFYHDLYHFVKGQDPTSQVAIAGIVQPTPLRLRYLDMVLGTYAARYGHSLPVDVWTVHGFILREEASSWGAGIPPGLDTFAAEGKLVEVAQHGDIEVFKTQIIEFRRWMAERGYRDRPLYVSEYGILMPAEYGYEHSVVRDFMLNSFDFFLTAVDAETGDPADDNRLVQRWSWFSLNAPEYDFATEIGFNGHLFDFANGTRQLLGADFANYTAQHVVSSIDLFAASIQVEPIILAHGTARLPSREIVQVRIGNRGGVAAHDVVARFWFGHPDEGGTLIGRSQTISIIRPGCRDLVPVELEWTPSILAEGIYQIYVQLQSANAHLETNGADNMVGQPLLVMNQSFSNFVFLPQISGADSDS